MLETRVCLTVLTGSRLHLLRRTLDSLSACAAPLLRDARVVAYCNGSDRATHAYLQGLHYADQVLYRDTWPPEPVGDAVSRLVGEVEASGARYWLHLEDDWGCQAQDYTWLYEAAAILDHHPEVGQVRLRRQPNLDSPLRYHMMDWSLHCWTPAVLASVECWVSRLNFTFNPTLTRVRDLVHWFPTDRERTVASIYQAQNWLSAHLLPGVFDHLGDEESLAGRLGRR